jgi:hypothetical protein
MASRSRNSVTQFPGPVAQRAHDAKFKESRPEVCEWVRTARAGKVIGRRSASSGRLTIRVAHYGRLGLVPYAAVPRSHSVAGNWLHLAMFIESTNCANTKYAFNSGGPQQKDAFPIRTLRVRQEFDATPQTQHGGYASGKGGRGAAAAAGGPVTECRGSLRSG